MGSNNLLLHRQVRLGVKEGAMGALGHVCCISGFGLFVELYSVLLAP